MSREKKIVVACYCRVSTDSGPQQSSFANQQSYFKDYLAASEKYKLYKIYADKGISGTLLHREYFDEMLIDAGLDIETVKSKSIQVQTISDTAKHKPSFATYKEYIVIPSDRPPKFTEILVRNTSRFARNVMIADILRKLLLKGVYVRFLDIDKTTEKPEDISFIQLFQNFDEMFSRDLSRKVRAGNERSVANKTVRSHPKLYGYKYTKRKNLNENNRLTLIPKEAEIVQKIYRLYAGCFSPDEAAFIGCNFKCSECDIKRSAGVGKRAIIKYLIENGKFTRGNKEFGTTTISNILRNEKYFGYINTGKYDTGELFNKNKFSKIREDYLLEPDPTNIDPIVSMELFNLCQSNRKERYDYVKSTGLPPTSSLYGGLLVCGTCGYKYLHNKDKDTGFYQCGLKKRKGVSACNSANVSEKIVAEYMQRLACGGISIELYQDRQDMVITLWVAVSKKLAFIGRNRSPKELQSLQEQLSSLEKELRTGYDMLMREKGDHTMLEKMIQEKKEALFSVQEQIDKRTKKPKIYLEESRTLIEYAYEILNELETRTKELTKRTYTADEVRTMIECITVYGETSPNGGKASSVLLKPKLKISEMVKDIIYKEEKDKEEYEQTPENIETVTLFPASGLKQEIDELAIKLEALELQYF